MCTTFSPKAERGKPPHSRPYKIKKMAIFQQVYKARRTYIQNAQPAYALYTDREDVWQVTGPPFYRSSSSSREGLLEGTLTKTP